MTGSPVTGASSLQRRPAYARPEYVVSLNTLSQSEAPMYNRNPNDVARERNDVPEIYEEEHERVAESDVELRRTTDPVSGTPPPTDPVDPVIDDEDDAERR